MKNINRQDITRIEPKLSDGNNGNNGLPKNRPSEPGHPSPQRISIDDVQCPNIWNYRNAFFFTGTIGTTIGYGNVYPSTSNGKLFCIFYALTAIPIFGFVNFRISSFIKIKYLQAEHKIFAYGFSFLEGWKYMDSIYFTVISLTTVGFGDYSPSFEGSEETGVKFMGVYRVLVLFWMLIGLAWLGSLLSLTSDKFGTILTTAFQKALNTDLSVPDFDYEPEKNRHLSNDDDSNECLMVPHDSGYFLHPTPHLHTVCRPIREDEPVVKWDTQKWEDF